MKVINDQGGGLNETSIRQSSSFTKARIQALNELLSDGGWGELNYKVGSLETMAPIYIATSAKVATRSMVTIL